jgi:hypothetical protein
MTSPEFKGDTKPVAEGLVWRASAALAATVALTPFSAPAQVSAAPPVAPGERAQEVDLIADLIYSSNVAGGGATVAAERGIKPSDVIFEPRVHLDIARPIGRETVYVVGDVGYDFYARNRILNRENIDIMPGVLGQIGRCQVGVSGEYSRAQRDLAELAVAPPGLSVRPDEKNTLQIEEIGGEAACVKSTGIGPSVTVSETATQNSAPLERFTDAQTLSTSGGVTYQRPVLGSVRLFGGFSQTDYPDRGALAGVPGVGVFSKLQTVSAGATYTRAVGSRLQGSVSLSYTDLAVEGSNLAGFKGLTYSAALTYLVSSRLTTTVQIVRATTPSNRLNSAYAIDQTYSGQATYRLGSRLSLTAGGSYLQDNFNGVSSPIAFDLTEEKILTVFGTATFKLARRFSFDLNIQHLQRTANFAGFGYGDTRLGLTARATF